MFANCYYIIFCVIRCLFCLACSCQFAMMLFFAIFVPSVAFSGLSPYSLSFSRIERLRTLYFGFCVLFTSCFLWCLVVFCLILPFSFVLTAFLMLCGYFIVRGHKTRLKVLIWRFCFIWGYTPAFIISYREDGLRSRLSPFTELARYVFVGVYLLGFIYKYTLCFYQIYRYSNTEIYSCIYI